jgi:hypothetical protein
MKKKTPKRRKPRVSFKVAASLTFYSAAKMSRQGRMDIAAWLRRQADDLVSLGDQYSSGRTCARYHYPVVKKK